MAAAAKQLEAKKKRLLARARAEKLAMAPIVKRVLARHGKAGQKVYVIVDGVARWVTVSHRGVVKEAAARPYGARRSNAPSRKK